VVRTACPVLGDIRGWRVNVRYTENPEKKKKSSDKKKVVGVRVAAAITQGKTRSPQMGSEKTKREKKSCLNEKSTKKKDGSVPERKQYV